MSGCARGMSSFRRAFFRESGIWKLVYKSDQEPAIKTMIEKALSNMKDLAELVAQSNTETSAAINARIFESLEEVKRQAVKIKKQTR